MYMLGKCFPNCWLEVSMYPEGTGNSHLETDFCGFALTSSNIYMVSNFQAATECLSCNHIIQLTISSVRKNSVAPNSSHNF
jgi:hypothetical protein